MIVQKILKGCVNIFTIAFRNIYKDYSSIHLYRARNKKKDLNRHTLLCTHLNILFFLRFSYSIYWNILSMIIYLFYRLIIKIVYNHLSPSHISIIKFLFYFIFVSLLLNIF